MKAVKNNHAVSSALILLGLWTINILIVIFSSPFLIYNKIKALLTGSNDQLQIQQSNSSTAYLPRQIDSKL